MTEEQYDGMMQLLVRIAVAVENQKVPSEDEDTFGIRPDALYTDEEVQRIFSCGEKKTRSWRNEYGLKYHQRYSGKKGSRIWYYGRDLIEFFRAYAIPLGIKRPIPIKKDVPPGHK